jgi:hypothetical protein
MEVYKFRSDSTPSISALTSDLTGANLPAGYSPWHPENGGKAMRLGPLDPILRAVAQDGLFLLSGRRSSGKRG